MDKAQKWCPWHNGGLGQMRPIEEFSLDAHTKDKKQAQCRECRNDHKAKYYAAHGASLNDRYISTRATARKRELEFSLTKAQYASLISKPCAYAIPESPQYVRIGLDRKNSTQGYVAGHCVPCCLKHNVIKGEDWSHEQMLDIVLRYGVLCGDLPVGRPKLPRKTYVVRNGTAQRRPAGRSKRLTNAEMRKRLAAIRLVRPRISEQPRIADVPQNRPA